MKISISSGHGKYISGAIGIINEHDEAVLVVNALAKQLRNRDVEVVTFEDTASKTQSENLDRIVDWHNAQSPCDVAISVHFNAFEQRSQPVGTEVWYYSQQALAADLSAAIASVGLIDRGAKKSTSLAFLTGTTDKSVLLEICFVDSEADCAIYADRFDDICEVLADTLAGEEEDERPDRPDLPERPSEDVLFQAIGKMSYFGGPDDTTGMTEQEGLAFHYEINEHNQQLFLPINTGTGLARQLNPFVPYLAVRWDYERTPKEMLAKSGQRALVRALATGRQALAWPADWGPNESTDRVADLSPGLCEILGIETDDEVEVIYPWEGEP